MKKLLLPVLFAATVFASCASGDKRLESFENKQFGEYIIKQEKLFNDMISAIDAKDSAKIKTIEKEIESFNAEGEKFMSSASEADIKKAGEILEPVVTKYFQKVMGDAFNMTDTTAPETDTDTTTPVADTTTPAAQ